MPNGRIVASLIGLTGVLAGALVTTLIFSFSFYGLLKDVAAQTGANTKEISNVVLLVSQVSATVNAHIIQPGHTQTLEEFDDHEARLRALERGAP